MPWLAGTAFVHSVAVMEKRDALKVWTIFLAILAFSFSLLGTFLVRSGVLTSVHAFANDPRRGVFILAILALFIFGSFALFAWRAPALKQGGLFAPISREGALIVNNLLLTTSCATVLFGTLYPLALEQLTGEKITVGAPFFNLTCGALLLTACFVAPFGFSLAWKRGDLLAVAERLTVALIGGAAAAVLGAAWLSGRSVFAPLAAGLAIFVILGTLIEVVVRARRPGATPGVALKRALGLPLSFYGGALAHLGVGVTLLGLAGLGFGAETIATLRKGVPERVGPYSITLDWVGDRVGPNYKEAATSMTVRSGDAVVAEIAPARRQFEARQVTTTQAGLATLDFGQVYVAIADPTPDGDVPARLYWKPLVTLIWLGAAAMALGGDPVARRPAPPLRRRGAGEGRPRLARAARTMIMRLVRFALLLMLALGAAPASAVQPDEVMKDPALEARARALSEELRCLVCQNQSIDDSDAPLARDIRILIRSRIAEGESNEAVRAYLVSRYGDFILLKPPFKPETVLLWLSPALVLGAGLASALFARRRTPQSVPALSAEEEERLAALTGNDGGGN